MLTRSNRRYGFGLIMAAAFGMVAGACAAGGGASSISTEPAPASATAASAAASSATGMMASGQFHDVDGSATGEAQLVVKPGGAYAVVLEQFKIAGIEHTNIVLVSNADVSATADVDKGKLLDLGPLKAAEGMQDFPIPPDMASGVMAGYHTVVVWDTAMAHAIAAAPLK
jgi:Electron transfer DM13